MPPSLCWSKAACDCARRAARRVTLTSHSLHILRAPRAVGSVSTVLHTSHMNTVRSQSLNHSHALLSDGDPATRRGVHTSHARSRADARARPRRAGARACPRPAAGRAERGVGRARRVCTAEFSAATLYLRILSPHVTRILYTAHPNTDEIYAHTTRRPTARNLTGRRAHAISHVKRVPHTVVAEQ